MMVGVFEYGKSVTYRMGIQLIIDRWFEKSSIENQRAGHAGMAHFGVIWIKQEDKFKRCPIWVKLKDLKQFNFSLSIQNYLISATL
jgi:hypothetical protein